MGNVNGHKNLIIDSHIFFPAPPCTYTKNDKDLIFIKSKLLDKVALPAFIIKPVECSSACSLDSNSNSYGQNSNVASSSSFISMSDSSHASLNDISALSSNFLKKVKLNKKKAKKKYNSKEVMNNKNFQFLHIEENRKIYQNNFIKKKIRKIVKVKRSDFCILFFHANACDIGQAKPMLKYICNKLKICAVLFEYPGYGMLKDLDKSAESVDLCAKVALKYVAKALNFSLSRIILMGQSIGCGPAACLAYDLFLRNKLIGGIVLISPYTLLSDAAADIMDPYGLSDITKILVQNKWNVKNALKNIVNIPLCIIHGKKDNIISWHHGYYLYEISNTSRNMKICHFPVNGDHINLDLSGDIVNPVKKLINICINKHNRNYKIRKAKSIFRSKKKRFSKYNDVRRKFLPIFVYKKSKAFCSEVKTNMQKNLFELSTLNINQREKKMFSNENQIINNSNESEGKLVKSRNVLKTNIHNNGFISNHNNSTYLSTNNNLFKEFKQDNSYVSPLFSCRFFKALNTSDFSSSSSSFPSFLSPCSSSSSALKCSFLPSLCPSMKLSSLHSESRNYYSFLFPATKNNNNNKDKSIKKEMKFCKSYKNIKDSFKSNPTV